MLLLLFAISLPGLSTSAVYQPIKITVNENFHGHPSPLAQGLPSLASGFLHQGANFFFNPPLEHPLGFIPPHIEALVASTQNKQPEITVEEKKITDLFRPIELIPEINIKDDVLETIKINELPAPKPVDFLVKLPLPEPVEVIEEKELRLPTSGQNFIQEFVTIPEAPKLPPLSINFVPPVITEELKVEEPTELVLPCAVKVDCEKPTFLENGIPLLPDFLAGSAFQALAVSKHQGSVMSADIGKPFAETMIMDEKNIAPIICV